MNRRKKLKIAVLAGGPSYEYEVSLSTAQGVMSHLDSQNTKPN